MDKQSSLLAAFVAACLAASAEAATVTLEPNGASYSITPRSPG